MFLCRTLFIDYPNTPCLLFTMLGLNTLPAPYAIITYLIDLTTYIIYYISKTTPLFPRWQSD
ncbi:hypothetical protein SAMN05216522_10233 [Rosenbergiella nectarea]|uniref:Uncharacterized protein n=1 Tax=Rosenbergiella nectarea TaxID=988801 RepID=A0A1H9ERJ7_9GAMM|nr:hypothetical protein SAMN05216522_10233 [Rosenbergiella nectarea]